MLASAGNWTASERKYIRRHCQRESNLETKAEERAPSELNKTKDRFRLAYDYFRQEFIWPIIQWRNEYIGSFIIHRIER